MTIGGSVKVDVSTGGSCGTTGVHVSTGGRCGTAGVRVSTGGRCGTAGVRVSTGGRCGTAGVGVTTRGSCGTAGGHVGGIVIVARRVAIGTGWGAGVVLMCFSNLCSNIVNASFKASTSFSRYLILFSLDCKVYIKFMLKALPKLLLQIKLPNLMMFSHYCTHPHVQVLHLETFLMIHHWNTSNPNDKKEESVQHWFKILDAVPGHSVAVNLGSGKHHFLD